MMTLESIIQTAITLGGVLVTMVSFWFVLKTQISLNKKDIDHLREKSSENSNRMSTFEERIEVKIDEIHRKIEKFLQK